MKSVTVLGLVQNSCYTFLGVEPFTKSTLSHILFNFQHNLTGSSVEKHKVMKYVLWCFDRRN